MGIAEVGSSGGLDPLVWTNTRAARLDAAEAGLTSAIKSVQRGVTTSSALNVNITISAVTPLKCLVVIVHGNSTSKQYDRHVASLTTTVLTLSQALSSSTPVSWEVIEYV